MQEKKYLTVLALTKYIKRKFDADPHLQDVHVRGEISNFKQHSSGHMYFTLKDEKARILSSYVLKSITDYEIFAGKWDESGCEGRHLCL